MASWRIAESLETLRKQLNDAFPKRSKASDGGIGDAKHASRSSDHNPYIKHKGVGIVTARDFTHDPKTGIDCQWLADILSKHKDPRIKYLIWNHRICSSKTSPWKWRPYSGVNAHTKHLHISVDADPKLFDSTKQWTLDFPKQTKSDVAKISAATPQPPHLSNEPVAEVTDNDSSAITPPNDTPTETTQIKEIESDGQTDTVAVTVKNEQDVNVPAVVTGPKNYNDIGLKDTLIQDAKGVVPANVGMQTVSELMSQATGWPPWVAGLITKLALIVLILSVCWVLYRVGAWIMHSWRENERVKLLANINSDVTRKNVELEPHVSPEPTKPEVVG